MFIRIKIFLIIFYRKNRWHAWEKKKAKSPKDMMSVHSVKFASAIK